MQTVLEQGSIDKPLTFDVGLIQLVSYQSDHLYMQHFSQIAPRVCTSVLFIIIESVDSISRDERDVPLTQYITNA